LDLANNQGVEETTFTIPIESKPQGTDYRFPGDYQIRILW
jgi:hypothetical protein